MTPSEGALRPRPLSDLPLAPLMGAGEELARDWLIALIALRPLHDSTELLSGRFAAKAPGVCLQVLRALASDGELDRLTVRPADAPGGVAVGPAADLAELVGAPDLRSTVQAVDVLRSTLWRRLCTALPELSAQRLAELADRLALTCSTLTATAVTEQAEAVAGGEHATGARPGYPRIEVGSPEQEVRAVELEEAWGIAEGADAPEPAGSAPAGWDAGQDLFGADAAVEPPAPETPEKPSQPDAPEEPPGWRAPEEPPGWRAGGPQPRWGAGEVPEGPFAVLAVELVGVEHLRGAEGPGGLDRLAGQVGAVMAGALRPSDRLAADGAGRWWLVAPQTDYAGAKRLAGRLAKAVREGVSHRGAPLEVVMGVAVSPEDGVEAPGLARRAETELYAARAGGLPVTPAR